MTAFAFRADVLAVLILLASLVVLALVVGATFGVGL